MMPRPCDWCRKPVPNPKAYIHEECVWPEVEAILAGKVPFIRDVAPPPVDPDRAERRRLSFAARAEAGRAKMAALDEDDLRRRLAAGETYTTIALAYDVDQKTIRLRARKLGIAREARAA